MSSCREKVKNIVISGTNFWNPGDDFVRDGVVHILRRLFKGYTFNFLFYNFNADFFPQKKFSGISNMLAAWDLDRCREYIDAVVVVGLSAGLEIKDMYNWIIKNGLHDRVYLIGAGYENTYVDRFIYEEPEATIFKNAKVIIGRTEKTPSFIPKLGLPYHHINCPAILSVENVKDVPVDKQIEKIGFSIQIPHEKGIVNQATGGAMYKLATEIFLNLSSKYDVEVVAHHKTEYFHFLDLLKDHDIPVVFSSFYQDLFDIYPRYDLVISTRLHACLFANGFGIPAFIINETERHTQTADGLPHSICVNNMSEFNEEFEKILSKNLRQIAQDALTFKEQLMQKYLNVLAGPFGLKTQPLTNQTVSTEQPSSEVCCRSDAKQSKSLNKVPDDYQFDTEIHEQKLVRNIVKEGMTVFDVGAHLGKYTKLLSLLAGDKGRVYAFEPTESSFQKLAATVREFNCTNVTLVNKAVYSENRKVVINEFPEEYSSWNSLGRPEMENPKNPTTLVPIEKSVEVEAVTLDSFCKQHNISKIDYLKLDVEGAEIKALVGASELLENKAIRHLQFEISKKMLEGLKTKAKFIFDLLKSKGYECHRIKSDGNIGITAADSDSFYENYIAFPSKIAVDTLLTDKTQTQNDRDKTQANALNQKGEALLAIGDIEGALNAFTKAIEIHSDFSVPYNNLGVLFWQKGQIENAVKHFVKALEIDPNNRDTIWNCAEVFKSLQRFEDAGQIYSSYLKRNPDDKEIASALLQLQPEHKAPQEIDHQTEETRPDAQRPSAEATACPSKSAQAKALNQQGEYLFVKGDIEGALNAFTRAIAMHSDFALPHNNLGVLFWKEGQTENAVKHFVKALEIDPNDRDTISNYAEAFKSLQRFEDARQIYSSYLKRNPDDKEIANALLQLQDGAKPSDRDNHSKKITNPSHFFTIDKLNIGCGLDYREGFINIDGNPDLPRVDYVLEVKPGVLLDHFEQGSFNYILINDFLEHNFHWEARSLLKDFHALLRSEGQLDITLPNVESIINDLTRKVNEKVRWLYGGQDIRQSREPNALDLSREKYPQYYCHKYGWTPESIKSELLSAGFSPVKITDCGWNMRIVAQKKVKTFDRSKPSLPIHFFSIVLNGQPFIRHHIEVFKKLPFRWHWHIAEGVADLKHDTAWSLKMGGRISNKLHRNGRSNDSTTEYLDELAQQYPENITVHRKSEGVLWDGKLEMVNATLANILEECLLWQVDADELWTVEQIYTARDMFITEPDRTAAYYLNHFFVGENLVTTTTDTYGNNTSYEWLRTWRFKPGFRWVTHEPPRLCMPAQDDKWVDIATINPFKHHETTAKNLVFQHYAYVTKEQLAFKEIYYGYKNATEQWLRLQRHNDFPVFLKDYFAWVKDGAQVNTVQSQNITPLAWKDTNGQWHFSSSHLSSEPQPTLPSKDSNSYKNILWIRPDSIGDNVLAASMLPYIRKKYKNAKITIVCQEHIAKLYEACPYADNIIALNKGRFLQNEQYFEEIMNSLRTLKAGLSLHSVYSRELAGDLLAIMCDAKQRIALKGDTYNILAKYKNKLDQLYTRLLTSEGKHKLELDRHKDFLRGLNIDVPSLKPMIWTTFEDEEFAEKFFEESNFNPEHTIALFAGAQQKIKSYDKYGQALSEFCKENHLNVVALGAENDRNINQRNLSSIGVKTVNLSGKTTIGQSAEILRRCRLAFGADTGLAHISCAVAVPNVILLGGAHFGRFMPYSPLTSIVCLPLKCYGCNWGCRYQDSHCIKGIKPEVIAEALRQTFAKPSEKIRVFVQGKSLWEPNPWQPAWCSFEENLDIDTIEIIPVPPEPSRRSDSLAHIAHLLSEELRPDAQHLSADTAVLSSKSTQVTTNPLGET